METSRSETDWLDVVVQLLLAMSLSAPQHQIYQCKLPRACCWTVTQIRVELRVRIFGLGRVSLHGRSIYVDDRFKKAAETLRRRYPCGPFLCFLPCGAGNAAQSSYSLIWLNNRVMPHPPESTRIWHNCSGPSPVASFQHPVLTTTQRAYQSYSKVTA
jgi:hypothetical protein